MPAETLWDACWTISWRTNRAYKCFNGAKTDSFPIHTSDNNRLALDRIWKGSCNLNSLCCSIVFGVAGGCHFRMVWWSKSLNCVTNALLDLIELDEDSWWVATSCPSSETFVPILWPCLPFIADYICPHLMSAELGATGSVSYQRRWHLSFMDSKFYRWPDILFTYLGGKMGKEFIVATMNLNRCSFTLFGMLIQQTLCHWLTNYIRRNGMSDCVWKRENISFRLCTAQQESRTFLTSDSLISEHCPKRFWPGCIS